MPIQIVSAGNFKLLFYNYIYKWEFWYKFCDILKLYVADDLAWF